MEISKDDRNQIIDEIIKSRRSVRVFKEDKPPKEWIEAIIEAGMLAPYAALMIDPKSDFRRFFVIKKDNYARKEMANIMQNQVKRAYEAIKEKAEKNPQIAKKSESVLNTLKSRSEKGLPNFEDAPYFIVVAEAKGPMPVEQWSLGHCLENMWLKATALELGFQLISATEQMSNNDEFCNVLGIPAGKFGLNGCLIGYPQNIPPATPRPDPEKSTRWLE